MTDDTTLDPEDWEAFRAEARKTLDAAITHMQSAADGPVWQPLPEPQKEALRAPLPIEGRDISGQLKGLLPYGVGNTHPRFFGWVHGAGTPSNIMAEMVAAAMNANVGGRDHSAIYVEQQVLEWCREIFDFPADSSGLIVSGTSMATLVALKVARDQVSEFTSRQTGVPAGLVGYASEEAHSCVQRTFDILGLGNDALRSIEVDANYEMDCDALQARIADDRARGLTPFAIVGSAGTVNVGAIDDLQTLADIADTQGLWLHIDGAFGAPGVLSELLRPRLAGLERADSIAFDFHKWLHVNYDAGMVLVRSEALHHASFSARPDYLKAATRGLAAGDYWPTEYGPELSRGFRALKVWTHLSTHGTRKLGELITRNCEQARYLAERVEQLDDLQLLAPVAMQICCFRYAPQGLAASAVDALNEEIVMLLQERGLAAPSITRIDDQVAIRVNITNHRTRTSDLDLLLGAVQDIGTELTEAA